MTSSVRTDSVGPAVADLPRRAGCQLGYRRWGLAVLVGTAVTDSDSLQQERYNLAMCTSNCFGHTVNSELAVHPTDSPLIACLPWTVA